MVVKDLTNFARFEDLDRIDLIARLFYLMFKIFFRVKENLHWQGFLRNRHVSKVNLFFFKQGTIFS